ncbi:MULTISPECIES: hypothetical protein [unclassified Saccharothrix]|uniref:hypothetical protein n=1 Tax=unclassified Saccharothrix TaxID=2593673 RepID=UPI00307E7A21
MAAQVEVPFSDLINKPKDTVAKLKQAPGERLRLRRRDDEDLVLTTASRAARTPASDSVATRMFVAMMQRDPGVRTLVTEVVPEVFPWVRYLPTESVREFVVELVEALRATDDLDTKAPVDVVIAAWKHTAEVYADPELLKALTQAEHGDFGPVPPPEVGS